MKLLSRTLAILAAALVVAGVALTLGQSSYAQSLFPARPEQAAMAQASGSTSANTKTAGVAATANQTAPTSRPDHEGGESPSLFGAVQVLQNLVIVGAIVGGVALVSRLGQRKAVAGSQ